MGLFPMNVGGGGTTIPSGLIVATDSNGWCFSGINSLSISGNTNCLVITNKSGSSSCSKTFAYWKIYEDGSLSSRTSQVPANTIVDTSDCIMIAIFAYVESATVRFLN